MPPRRSSPVRRRPAVVRSRRGKGRRRSGTDAGGRSEALGAGRETMMLTAERKRAASPARAKGQPARRGHQANPSGDRGRQRVRSCACGGSCPRCQAAPTKEPRGTCATCAKEDEAAARSRESIKEPTGTIGDGHDLQAARFSGDLVLEGCYDNEQFV